MEVKNEIQKQRLRLLVRIERVLEVPMIFLGFLWLVILIIDLVWGLSPAMVVLSTTIWIIFILDFLLKLVLAPSKVSFLKRNMLTIFSLIIPALRVVRIVRVIRLMRVFRGFRLVRMLASINRSAKSLNATMSRRGTIYVLVLTVVIVFAGAAGMLAFEKSFGQLTTYPDALWWTMMRVITAGSDYWPRSSEGRALCFLIALYGFAVFGYITATLASFFIDMDASAKNEKAPDSPDIVALRKEIRDLHQLLQNTDLATKQGNDRKQ